jgi:hypothetical protein
MQIFGFGAIVRTDRIQRHGIDLRLHPYGGGIGNGRRIGRFAQNLLNGL